MHECLNFKTRFDQETGELLGYDTATVRVLGEKFNMGLEFVPVKFGVYDKKTDSYSAGSANAMVGKNLPLQWGWITKKICLNFQLKSDEIQMAIGLQTQTYVERRFFHTTVYLDYNNVKWVTRTPVPLVDYRNLIRPFSSEVWALLYVSLAGFAIMFTVLAQVYLAVGGEFLHVNMLSIQFMAYSLLM